jgi:nucleobase:cation symporter-1, NCS1 family
VDAFRLAGDRLFDGFGWIAIFGLMVGLLTVMAVNAYGGSLSMISIADSIKRVRPTRRVRIASIVLMTAVVWSIAQFVGEERFFEFYGNVLVFLAYLFTPWTAINLVDYFFVRRGVYSIREIFNPAGIYGRWGWRGQTAYGIGLATMAPFFVTTPFTGPLAKELGSVDLSLFVGLPVSALVYLALTRNLDLARERELAEAEGVLPTVHR